MRSGVKTVSFDDRIMLLGVINHYVTLHQRVKIVTPRGIAEESDYGSATHGEIIRTRKKRTQPILKVCKNNKCKREFTPKKHDVVFCSKSCAKQALKKVRLKICENPKCAKKEFDAPYKHSRFCCKSCSNAGRTRLEKECANPVCKKQFQPNYKDQKFCCLKCSALSKGKNNDTR